MFCWSSSLGCTAGTFAPASVPLYNEFNVGFTQSFATLYLATLPANHGIVIVSTAVGGTGFYGGNWFTANLGLTAQMLTALNFASSSIGTQLGGTPQFDLFLWHQGEEDAGDNGAGYSASCWYYLHNDIGPFIDFVRANSPGASPTTPFVVGGLLPYWLSQVSGAHGVEIALYTINATRAYTATADSSIFPNYLPNSVPDGDPNELSGHSGLVIHFNATQAVMMGQQFFNAYQQAVVLTTPTTAATSDTGCGAPPSPSAVAYTNRAGMNASSNFTANSLSYIVWGQNSSLCVQGVQPVASVQLTLQLCSVGSIAQMWNVTSTGFAVAANSGPSPYYFNSNGACGANHALYEYPVANLSSLSTSAFATIVVGYSTYQQITLCGYCVDPLSGGTVGTVLTVQLCNYTASVSSQQFQFAPARLPSPPAAVAYINAAGMNASSNYTANSLSYIVWGQNSSLCVQGVQPIAAVQLTLQPCSVGSIAQMWNVTSTGFAVAANSGASLYYFNSNGACGANHALYEYPVANPSSLSALSLASIVVGYSSYQQITLCGYCVDPLTSGGVGTALTVQLCNYTSSISSQQFQFAPAGYSSSSSSSSSTSSSPSSASFTTSSSSSVISSSSSSSSSSSPLVSSSSWTTSALPVSSSSSSSGVYSTCSNITVVGGGCQGCNATNATTWTCSSCNSGYLYNATGLQHCTPTQNAVFWYPSSVSYTDPYGLVWNNVTTPFFVLGATGTNTTTHAIAATSSQTLYQTELDGPVNITFSQLNNTNSYLVSLLFSENSCTSVGCRVFSVFLQKSILCVGNLDVYSQTFSPYAPYIVNCPSVISATSTVEVDLVPVSGLPPFVDAIMIVNSTWGYNPYTESAGSGN